MEISGIVQTPIGRRGLTRDLYLRSKAWTIAIRASSIAVEDNAWPPVTSPAA